MDDPSVLIENPKEFLGSEPPGHGPLTSQEIDGASALEERVKDALFWAYREGDEPIFSDAALVARSMLQIKDLLSLFATFHDLRHIARTMRVTRDKLYARIKRLGLTAAEFRTPGASLPQMVSRSSLLGSRLVGIQDRLAAHFRERDSTQTSAPRLAAEEGTNPCDQTPTTPDRGTQELDDELLRSLCAAYNRYDVPLFDQCTELGNACLRLKRLLPLFIQKLSSQEIAQHLGISQVKLYAEIGKLGLHVDSLRRVGVTLPDLIEASRRLQPLWRTARQQVRVYLGEQAASGQGGSQGSPADVEVHCDSSSRHDPAASGASEDRTMYVVMGKIRPLHDPVETG